MKGLKTMKKNLKTETIKTWITPEIEKHGVTNKTLGLDKSYKIVNVVTDRINDKIIVKATKDLDFEQAETNREDLAKYINKVKAPVVKTKKADTKGTGVMALISIADFHLGRLVHGESCDGYNYDSRIAKNVFHKMADDLADRLSAAPYNIEQIQVNYNGDYFNQDGVDNATTSGKHVQHTDTRRNDNLRDGTEMTIYLLEKLATVAPVNFFWVGGNHDEAKGYDLVWAIANRYHNHKRITVDSNVNPRQLVTYKNNVLMITHGLEGKKRAKNLPFIDFDAKSQFSKASNVEVLTGHTHTHQLTYTDTGVVHETFACAAPVSDDWTYAMGFNARGEAYINYYDANHRRGQEILYTADYLSQPMQKRFNVNSHK